MKKINVSKKTQKNSILFGCSINSLYICTVNGKREVRGRAVLFFYNNIMELKDKVKGLIDKGLEENTALFLVDWSISANNSIKIVLDGDNGVSVEDCVAISRIVEHNLDREVEDFSLEVTSAGVFSPLKLHRQYVKNIGRVLNVKTQTDTVEGTLKSVDETHVVLEMQVREPKPVGKGKITVIKEFSIALSEIKEAKVVIKI